MFAVLLGESYFYLVCIDYSVFYKEDKDIKIEKKYYKNA